jgi:hypothetical protein
MDVMIDVIERLHREFGAQHSRTEILAVVRTCHDQLDSVPAEAMPELLERLARQRLITDG